MVLTVIESRRLGNRIDGKFRPVAFLQGLVVAIFKSFRDAGLLDEATRAAGTILGKAEGLKLSREGEEPTLIE